MKFLLKVLAFLGAMLLGSALTIMLLPKVIMGQGGESGKLGQLMDYLNKYHVEELNQEELEDAAAAAMLAATGDRWAYYIPADEYESYKAQKDSAYVGIGVTVSLNGDNGLIEVVNVTAGGPADSAGMQTHDFIVGVDGTDCTGMTLEEVQTMIRGKAGTEVTITVSRDEVNLDLTMVRATVQIQLVAYELLPSGYGYIDIENFNRRSAQDTIAAMEELINQGAKGLIFDVRFNPGGYKDEMVDVLDYILPEGELFITEDYKGDGETDYSDANCIDIPIAVLVNGDSYSAAEFFAAALQEYEYGIIVGQQTTGKGHYQVTFNLSDGSAANFSIGKYYTPNGVNLSGLGITPDVIVDLDEETQNQVYFGDLTGEDDPQIQAAIDALESQDSP